MGIVIPLFQVAYLHPVFDFSRKTGLALVGKVIWNWSKKLFDISREAGQAAPRSGSFEKGRFVQGLLYQCLFDLHAVLAVGISSPLWTPQVYGPTSQVR